MTAEEMAYFHLRYDLLVRAVSRRICLPETGCDDLYQDTFARVFRRTRPVFANASDEKNWLVSICVNSYREMLRHRKRNERLPVFMRDAPSSPNHARRVMDKVYRLPKKYRLPIIMFYFMDKQTTDVASVLHISQHAVLARLRQGGMILADQQLDETLYSSFQWHDAENRTEEDAAFKDKFHLQMIRWRPVNNQNLRGGLC